jgi:hypothetical protein
VPLRHLASYIGTTTLTSASRPHSSQYTGRFWSVVAVADSVAVAGTRKHGSESTDGAHARTIMVRVAASLPSHVVSIASMSCVSFRVASCTVEVSFFLFFLFLFLFSGGKRRSVFGATKRTPVHGPRAHAGREGKTDKAHRPSRLQVVLAKIVANTISEIGGHFSGGFQVP